MYFWSYEARSWGSRRVWTYVGPPSRTTTRADVHRLLLEYHRRARAEMDRRIVLLEREAASVR